MTISKKEMEQLAMQARFTAAEAEWKWREEQKNGKMTKEQEDLFEHKVYLNRMYKRTDHLCTELADRQREIYILIERVFHALAGLAFLFALQNILLGCMIWKAVR